MKLVFRNSTVETVGKEANLSQVKHERGVP